MKYSEALKEVRREKGLSQSQAAKALGCSKRTLQQWEQSRCQPAEWCQSLVLKELKGKHAIVDLPA